MQNSYLMWTEIGIHNRTGYNPMGADSLPKIIEGVQQHHPQHSREVILKYYEYLKINFSQEFSDHGLGMVSRICDLIHKVQRQHSYLTWTEIGIQDRTGYNPVGADSLPKIIEGVQQHHPQHSRSVRVSPLPHQNFVVKRSDSKILRIPQDQLQPGILRPWIGDGQ
ncbi:uncharacterized protein LOC121269647 isoform X5 [Carcharodon carcharias]|uniref:uncharacterized protein LOC121269647 isoform X5 n=1 Tax=Carcharodon carcharias TaxID=13397 RepID=UPI001B7EB8BA|nr:uncharacterized protein LOC121269647 isoform X5 [Carcharodon carcharias]XP_041030344.1 uncharacterized protein LOC121269647 isoform X5 [Carcharodon carcharias]XP_041030345.1 uncharacterized protein LOC121269647 isoform X5 [Carcharodon carcharias]